MNLFENLQLFEHAKKRDKIIDYIYNSEKQRRLNLIQIFIFRDWTTIHHWCKELRAALYEIPKLKKQNMKEKWIYEWVWLDWEDEIYPHIDRWIRDICDKENVDKSKINYSKDNIYNFMKDYSKWLSYNLFIDTDITVDLVETKIKELLDKYSIN